MSDHPCCRINRGKMHYEDIKGAGNNMSDHSCCLINRVPLYLYFEIIQVYLPNPPAVSTYIIYYEIHLKWRYIGILCILFSYLRLSIQYYICIALFFKHWLPKLLGPFMNLLGQYSGYNPNLPSSIVNVFATAAYRFGHTMINPIMYRYLLFPYSAI